jgi:hypothetical protein
VEFVVGSERNCMTRLSRMRLFEASYELGCSFDASMAKSISGSNLDD